MSNSNKVKIAKGNKNNEWLDDETAKCKFADQRISKRFRSLIAQIWDGLGKSIPFACQDWANTKAAYRFFSNENVSEDQILEGHFQSTKLRFKETRDPILILHDTTTLSYYHSKPQQIGITYAIPTIKDKLGKLNQYAKCGVLMHSSLPVTTQGVPLGIAAIKFWTRKKFKDKNKLKPKVNPTRIAIKEKESYRWLENLTQATTLLAEPERCIHIGDRESDIYELFAMADTLKTNFLIRIASNRSAGEHTVADVMNKSPLKGKHNLLVRDSKSNLIKVALDIKYQSVCVSPPLAKQKKYSQLPLTVIYAQEKNKSKNREKIHWKLITNLPVLSLKAAIEKLNWYAMRWKIETFHKILKSGCKVESLKLRTADRLVKFIAISCILSWRIFWMTMLNRENPDALPKMAFTDMEIKLLNYLVKDKRKYSKKLSYYLIKLAKLGGYLARVNDSPPGNMVIWRGLTKLTDVMLGFNLALKLVGN